MSRWRQFFSLRKSPPEQILIPRRGFSFSGGATVNEDSAMQVSAFYRGVIFISSQIGKLPWEVKSRTNQILDDQVSYLIGLMPSPEMDAMTFRIVMVQQAIIHGNAYAEIERDILGRPVNVWFMPSQNVEVLRTPQGELVYRVVGGSQAVRGEDAYLPAKDVFHLRNFHTKDGVVGQGIVAYAANVLGISLGADRMAGNLFANGGLPSGVLEVPGVLSDEAFQRVKESWKEAHTGRKSGGIAILEEGMKYSPVMLQPDVMQFLESRKFSVLEVARFLGLPPTKLFDIEASTYSNQEQSNLEVATDTLDSWCRRLEMEADIKLLNRRFGGRRTEFDLYEIFRGDMTTRASYFSKMMQVAAMSPNEIRVREGMAPYSDGDRFFVAVNNYSPSDRLDEIIDSQIHKARSSQPVQTEQPADPNNQENPSGPNSSGLEQALIEYLKR